LSVIVVSHGRVWPGQAVSETASTDSQKRTIRRIYRSNRVRSRGCCGCMRRP